MSLLATIVLRDCPKCDPQGGRRLIAGIAGLLFVIATALPGIAWASCSGSSPSWNATPDLASISSCVSSASPGDTIHVEAGNATWTSTLTISKGIKLIGAGVGQTNITRSSTGRLINYSPSSANFASNYPLRISGFSFLLGGSGQAIQLNCSCKMPAQTNIRIDNNRFSNSGSAGGGVEHNSCFGVVDHNTFDGMYSPIRGWGDSCSGYSPSTFGRWTWESFGQYEYGTPNVLYIEDNTISLASSHYMVSDGDQGCSYVFRYNTINTAGDAYPVFDYHGGGQRGNLWGCRGGEIYGNNITGGGFLVSQRGGRVSVHHNTLSNGGSVNIYDNDGCPLQGVSPYDTYQKINNSYHFLNRRSATGTLLGMSSSGGDNCSMVVRNSTYWMDNTNCEAPGTCTGLTAGIGCGTLADRPATCTTGVAYWATDQSCSNLSGMIGANPSSPLSGTLYQCTSTNTWTAYYKPYPYPHPLTAGGGTPQPAQYTVTPSTGPNGTISPSSPRTASAGDRLQFTVTPAAGYAATVSGSCGGTLTGTTYTTNPVQANCTVAASFSPLVVLYTVTPSAGPNGSISPSGPTSVVKDTAAQFTVTPSPGYAATVGGTCGGTLAGTTYTTKTITANCTVAATFSPIVVTHTVTPSAGQNGTISPSAPQTVNNGSATQFTVTPNAGYAATVVGTCGGTLAGNSYTTNAVTADCYVRATFSPIIYTRTVTPSAGPNGTISPSTPQTINDGSTVQFLVTPDAGYAAVVAGTCGGILEGKTYTTSEVRADCTVEAAFSPLMITHTVTPSGGPNGTISPSAPQTVNDGNAVRFTVTPAEGYGVEMGGTCGGILTGTSYTTNAVTADCTVTAAFTQHPVMHTVTPSAGPNGTINPSSPGTVSEGAVVQYTVTPNSGYQAAVGGSCGGTLKDETYTTDPVTADCTITATFTLLPGNGRTRPAPPRNIKVK